MALSVWSSMLPALLSQLCSMSLCQPVKPEGTLWVNQRQSSANTPSGRGPAKGAKASRERGKKGACEWGEEKKMEVNERRWRKKLIIIKKKNPGVGVFVWSLEEKIDFISQEGRENDLFCHFSSLLCFFILVKIQSCCKATSSQWSTSSLSVERTNPVPF